MSATKLLYVFVLVAVIIAVYFVFIVSVNPRFYDTIEDNLGGLIESGQCTVGVQDPFKFNECRKKATEFACTDDPECSWCQGEVNNQIVSTCTLRTCGCSESFFEEARIDLVLDKVNYEPGETIVASGKIETNLVQDKSGLEVTFSFLKKELSIPKEKRIPTKDLGNGGVVETKNSDGEFEWEFEIPDQFRGGEYYMLAEYLKDPDLGIKVKDIEFFSIRPGKGGQELLQRKAGAT